MNRQELIKLIQTSQRENNWEEIEELLRRDREHQIFEDQFAETGVTIADINNCSLHASLEFGQLLTNWKNTS